MSTDTLTILDNRTGKSHQVPVAAAPAPRLPRDHGDGMGQGGSRVILVVDDEIDLAMTLTRLLGRHGYRAIAVDSCEEARAAMRAETPALVVSDLRLPDGDGLDLVRSARAQAPPIPAIVMTGHASPGTQRAALEAGAFAFLAKPFPTTPLVVLVEEALRT